MRRTFYLASICLLILFACYKRYFTDDKLNSQYRTNQLHKAPIQDLPVISKRQTINTNHSLRESKEQILSESETEAINLRRKQGSVYHHLS